MKKSINIILSLVLVIFCAAAVFAQDDKAKNEMFGKIAKLSQTKKPEDREKAYQMSKEFLAKYGVQTDDQVKKIKDFADKYRLSAFNKNLDELKIAEAFALGKEILAQEPENTYVVINMAYGGYDLFERKKDNSFASESANYAKQALSLLEAGKVPTTFEPFKTKDEATAIMHYIIGAFSLDKNPAEAAHNFYKALQYESQIKNTSYPYYGIAYGYEKAYENLAKAYQVKMGNKAPEAELLKEQAKIEKIVDRMMDAYARAVKMAETDNNTGKDAWKQRLTEVYKFRKQSDTGLSEYISSIMSTPLPDPSQL
jgi:hypothetical protein